jgi:hypothetical protein
MRKVEYLVLSGLIYKRIFLSDKEAYTFCFSIRSRQRILLDKVNSTCKCNLMT